MKPKAFRKIEMAKSFQVNLSSIVKHERDDVKPSIDLVKKMAVALGTTAGYLMRVAKNTLALKDQAMLKCINDINNLPEDDKNQVLYAINGLIKYAKLNAL